VIDTPRSVRFVGGIVVGWVLLEAIVRTVAVVAGVAVLDAPLLGYVAGLALFPAIAAVLTLVAVRAGSKPADWGWRMSGTVLAVGLTAGLLRLALVATTAPVDAALFGDSGGDLVAVLRSMSPAVLALFVVGNGVLVPVAEEQVWRGIVQTTVVDRVGPGVGIGLVAVAFGLKHALIDWSLARLVTNVTGGLLYGTVRHRWGTTASTATHVAGNTIASVAAIAMAL
jgi:membrane protease YdiL (CAAX protease family)